MVLRNLKLGLPAFLTLHLLSVLALPGTENKVNLGDDLSEEIYDDVAKDKKIAAQQRHESRKVSKNYHHDDVKKYMQLFDLDSDGKVSLAEVKDVFQFDDSSESEIPDHERLALLEMRDSDLESISSLFKVADKDGDGALSVLEMKTSLDLKQHMTDHGYSSQPVVLPEQKPRTAVQGSSGLNLNEEEEGDVSESTADESEDSDQEADEEEESAVLLESDFATFLDAVDENKDGKVVLDEWIQHMNEQKLQEWKQDWDDLAITDNESDTERDALLEEGQDAGKQVVTALFSLADENEDGVLTPKELRSSEDFRDHLWTSIEDRQNLLEIQSDDDKQDNTDQRIDDVIRAIREEEEDEFDFELGHYPGESEESIQRRIDLAHLWLHGMTADEYWNKGQEKYSDEDLARAAASAAAGAADTSEV